MGGTKTCHFDHQSHKVAVYVAASLLAFLLGGIRKANLGERSSRVFASEQIKETS